VYCLVEDPSLCSGRRQGFLHASKGILRPDKSGLRMTKSQGLAMTKSGGARNVNGVLAMTKGYGILEFSVVWV